MKTKQVIMNFRRVMLFVLQEKQASSTASPEEMRRSALKIANLAAWLISRLPVLQQEDSEDVDMDSYASRDTVGIHFLFPIG